MRRVRRPVHTTSLLAVVAVGVVLAGCASETEEPGDARGATGERTPSATASGQLLEQTSADGRQLREVPAEAAPAVALEVTDDPDSGWNVHLDTERFAFAPERAGGEARPGEGHAHLYLDGDKIARLYGPWYHLPATAVPAGEHTLTVQLNANDHTVWATDGAPVSAETEITSTGGDGGHEHDDESEAAGDSTPASTPKADVNVDIAVSGGEVTPAPGRTAVAVGQTVRIEVTSDVPDTVHVHGYDVEAELEPSTPAVVEFTADQPGLFEVETHDSGLLLTQLVVE